MKIIGIKMLISTSNIRNMMVIRKKLMEKGIFFLDWRLNPHSNRFSFSFMVFIVFSVILRKMEMSVRIIMIMIRIEFIIVINFFSFLMEIRCTYILKNLGSSSVN